MKLSLTLMYRKMVRIPQWFSLLTLIWAPVWAYSAESAPQAPFVVGTGGDETSYVGMWTRLVYKEAFNRMHLPVTFTVAPIKRINVMAEQGRIDAEASRAPAFGLAHPDMIRVDVTLMEVVFSIYAAKPMPGVSRIEDLRDRNLHGTYTRGNLGCENVLLPMFSASQISAVPTPANGVAMLAVGHADFFCEVSSSMGNVLQSAAGRKGFQPLKLFDLGAKVPLHPYLQKKHAALAPVLTATLKKMKAEGLFERFWLQTEKEALSR